ncbi:SAYSvFN domain-containing protein 1 [Neodiprion pinetum]|uniref:SAYSvFN domain-containing protein 1 n=1 Tax=Neodiprion lecontei TaxID=441921 RepID=A0A6J0BQS1_NEOLC|nr:SAYSvFN domain-containing protein 1 [Neodiprion lecontei]XP_046481936.1 SAYSvFN domain-containing protein 1 [Neodiprion pinetum]XP_046623111.1 SAYSvFN domain-containing protein 1 [Neodiprion virginianus]
MEAKLAAYRVRKRKQAMVESMKNSVKGVLTWGSNTSNTSASSSPPPAYVELEDREDIESSQSEESLDLTPAENPVLTQVTYLLYFLLWATLYMIALQFEFGAVYFIVSSLVLIWKNTRSGPKKKGEISAYSVFNPNCQAIDGTLNAEQFEREIRYGASSVH